MSESKNGRLIQIPVSTDLNDINAAKITVKNKITSVKVEPKVDDFYALAPENKFIHVPTNNLWPARSIDARIDKINKIKASEWLAKNRSVEQVTWMPGSLLVMENKLMKNGEIVDAIGYTSYNLYQPPNIELGAPNKADMWIEHVKKVYPENAEHIFSWLAQRVQQPEVKINHALVLGGKQGIGKDTILEPVRHAIGPWNMEDVNPNQLLGRFNGFIKSVILRVSEARDLGDKDRYKLYEHLKTFTASPPMVLRCDEKNTQEYNVPNLCGVVITTNHKTSGIYLPADDRRHYVAWSEKSKEDFKKDYWQEIWDWYKNGGTNHVAAFLQTYDLDDFDSKSPPPKTNGFWEIVDSNRAPEDAELADVLDKLGYPDAVTKKIVLKKADQDFSEWLNDRRNSRQIPHRFETAGYVKVRNNAANDGYWSIDNRRTAVYAKAELSKRERINAVKKIKSKVPF